MKRHVLAALVAVGCLAAGVQAADGSASARLHAARVCPDVPAGYAACLSKILVDAHGAVPASTTPASSARTPAQLKAAYTVGSATSGGKTVAIVDAYGYPNLERDLGVYRSYFGLSACTKANGCLRVVDQFGGTSLPRFNAGWAGEQALDVDAVSALCPDCKILVIQAKSASFADLGTAVNTAAATPGVVAISNSYGSNGDASDATYGGYYNHPGIAVTAATGDNGYQGGSYPASSTYVTAVGGTSLVPAATTRGWAETVWSGSGSGCSSYNARPAFQASLSTGCPRRAMADVAAAADPNKGGMAVYYPTSKANSTWAQVGGTSEATPIIASFYALGTKSLSGYPNALPYANTGSLFDVTSGSNGSCTPVLWCTAAVGWDGPTGLGTPNGPGAF